MMVNSYNRSIAHLQRLNGYVNRILIRAHLLAFRKKKFSEIKRLYLIYHIAPIASNNIWLLNLDLLRCHLHKFDRIIIGIVTGDNMVSVDRIKQELRDYNIEWVVRPNNPSLGEVGTFLDMLTLVSTSESDGATFYAHAKGVSRPESKAIALWRKCMYQACLDNVDEIKHILSCYSCAGAFKKRGPQDVWKAVEPEHFHYSGNFFWFRNDQIFSKSEWKNVREYRYGVEEYLGRLLREEDAACLYGDYAGNLYNVNEYKKCENCVINAIRIFAHPMKKYFSKSL